MNCKYCQSRGNYELLKGSPGSYIFTGKTHVTTMDRRLDQTQSRITDLSRQVSEGFAKMFRCFSISSDKSSH